MEARADEAIVLDPPDRVDGGLGVDHTLEGGGTVDLDPEWILGTDGHPGEVMNVESDAGGQGLAWSHGSVADHAPQHGLVVLLAGNHHVVLAGVENVGRVTAVPPDLGFGTAAVRVAAELEFLGLTSDGRYRGDRGRTRRPEHRQRDVLVVEIATGTAHLHATLVLAVVPLVRDVADFQIVTAFLRLHVDPVVGRQCGVLDGGVVVRVARVRQPEVGGVVARRLEPASQHHRRALVSVDLRIADLASSAHSCNKKKGSL